MDQCLDLDYHQACVCQALLPFQQMSDLFLTLLVNLLLSQVEEMSVEQSERRHQCLMRKRRIPAPVEDSAVEDDHQATIS